MIRIIKAPTSSIRPGGSSKVESHADDLIEEIEFGDKEVLDDDRDYRAKKRGKGPPAKKARKGSAKQCLAESSSGTKGLSILPAIPLDVLFEIFSNLTPNDLVNLSRTSRILRDSLMTKNATSVWKAARDCVGAPECPSNMSEPHWAALLCEGVCESCGAKNVMRPDFLLLRRVCATCKKVNFVIESKFQIRFPGVDPEILELIPYTNVSAWSSGYGANNRYFWTPDINSMSQKIAEYERNIKRHRPGAKQALKDFKAQQIEFVTSIRECKRKREMEYERFDLERFYEKQAAGNHRFDSIKSKFLELGYADSDVDRIHSSPECHQRTQLTDRSKDAKTIQQ